MKTPDELDLNEFLGLQQEDYTLLIRGIRPIKMDYNRYKRYMRVIKWMVKDRLKGVDKNELDRYDKYLLHKISIRER